MALEKAAKDAVDEEFDGGATVVSVSKTGDVKAEEDGVVECRIVYIDPDGEQKEAMGMFQQMNGVWRSLEF